MSNSLAEVHPELVSEWSEKNLVNPSKLFTISCKGSGVSSLFIKR